MGMLEATEGVNTASVESPTTEATASNVEYQSNEQSLAEALKTDNAQSNETQHEKYVPYDRFQEVIKAKQELESQLSAEEYKQFQIWDQAVRQDPAVADRIKQALIDYYQGGQQQANPYQQQQMYAQQQQQMMDPNNPLSQVLPVIQAQQQQLQMLVQQQQAATYQKYEADFNNKANSIPEHWRPIYRNAVENLVGSINPNALQQYDPSLIQKAYETVHKQVEQLQRAERAAYVKDKSKDNLPPSSTGQGATPRVVSGDNSPEGRFAHLVQLLNSGS